MELVFLGTGAAWRTPELGCNCVVCERMRALGEARMRTGLWVRAGLEVMIDCGPDAARQIEGNRLGRPDLVLITHEHGDHYLGLDELEAFRRIRPEGDFSPIPVYAHPDAWGAIEARFGYLFAKLLEKREALPGRPIVPDGGAGLTVTPFKTDHGPMPKGSVGYALEYEIDGKRKKLVYTSDFKDAPEAGEVPMDADILVAQSHWFNEPEYNRPSHMSLQKLLGFIRAWRPRERVYLVHISDGDLFPGEEGRYMKKAPPLDPMTDPETGLPLPVPACAAEWDRAAKAVFRAAGIDVPVTVAHDGLRVGL